MKNKTKHSFITVIFFIFGLGLFCEPALVAAANVEAVASESTIYFKIENFTWKEFDDSGSQLLEESGPIYGIGFSASSEYANSLTAIFKVELFNGSIDYDGQTQAGTPVKTDTDYQGFKLEGDIGNKFIKAEKSSLEAFAGLGYRWWLRDIKSTSDAIGYEEEWWSIYARLGIRGEHIFSDQLKAFFETGAKLPMKTENEADLAVFGLGKVTLEPENEPSAFAEIGLKWNRLKTSVFYEGMRFSKSEQVIVRPYAIHQPESQADILGINVGMTF